MSGISKHPRFLSRRLTPNSLNTSQDKPASLPPSRAEIPAISRFAEIIALAGFMLFAVFAPHSIAGAEIALALVGAGWLTRALATRRTGIRRTWLDLPIWLFSGWTILSAIFSTE